MGLCRSAETAAETALHVSTAQPISICSQVKEVASEGSSAPLGNIQSALPLVKQIGAGIL